MAAGFRTLKLKAGKADTTATLVERVGAVRAAVGDDVALRLDANGTWGLEAATRRLRALAGFALQYVEQPLDPGALAKGAALRDRVGVPIAADEAVTSVAAARAVLDAGAADVLVVKPSRVGWPGGGRRDRDACRGAGRAGGDQLAVRDGRGAGGGSRVRRGAPRRARAGRPPSGTTGSPRRTCCAMTCSSPRSS